MNAGNGKAPTQDVRYKHSSLETEVVTKNSKWEQTADELNESKILQQSVNGVGSLKEKQKRKNKSGRKVANEKKEEFVVGKPRGKKLNSSPQKALNQQVSHKTRSSELQSPTESVTRGSPGDLQSEGSSLYSSRHSSFSDHHQDVVVAEEKNSLDAEKKKAETLQNRRLKHAQLAEMRRLEVERKRMEKEEEKRRVQEEEERQEKMKQELEEEMRKRLEQQRERKRLQEEEKKRREQEEETQRLQELKEEERERRLLEAYKKKLQEMQRKKQEEEEQRAAEMERRRQEEEKQLAEEQALLSAMKEQERNEYLRLKQEEEDRRKKADEERRKRREEETRRRLEEAKQEAERIIREKWELERKLQFHKELITESIGLEETQDITRPWVFSYFELLRLLELNSTNKE
ncbi:uncharacterized protein KIAA2012 homolog [Latimeria chalumnae]|uniref:uncharacterized protein KIAA2012 homolog n=1 Tax=Latimeria chalumnae TaxID=7897 RepID=UPI00313AEFF8